MTGIGANQQLILGLGLEIEEHIGLLDPRIDPSPGGERSPGKQIASF